MNYRLQLLNAINRYDEESEESYLQLRDIICEISDKEEVKKQYPIRELLFIAAQKLRVFGYNRMNNTNINDFLEKDTNAIEFGIKKGLTFILQNELIKAYYTSETGATLDINQMRVLDTYNVLPKKRIFLSAPTSFGKTFLLKEIIFKFSYKNILLIFPTVALLNENMEEITKFSKENKLPYKTINNTKTEFNKHSYNIFILTPERALKILADHPDLTVDFFFMDEIYKIDNFFGDSSEEDDRDKVFRITLYLLSKKTDSFYLAGPYINLKNLGQGLNKFISDNNIELIYERNELVKKKYYTAWKKRIDIDELKIEFDSTSKISKTYTLTKTIKELNMGTTIVFCANQNQILELADYYNNKPSLYKVSNNNYRLMKFIDHLKNRYGFKDGNVNVQWLVPELLDKGIGLHHGSLPKYIQNEILQTFNKSYIDVIISTTSITEGVNTNSKNLIFYGTSKGGKPFKIFDIKNIIGRAGRYYHNFIGNIFLLEKEIFAKLSTEEEESLDFITFTDKPIANVDIDNTSIFDLIGENKVRKLAREDELQNKNIPEEVFVKNRLFDRLSQANLAEQLNSFSDHKLMSMIVKYSNIKNFLESNALKEILEILNNLNIIESHELERYPAISTSYSIHGFRGLLSYQIKKYKEKNPHKPVLNWKEYNQCYKRAFDNVKKVIEYKIPKLINLFSTIFNFVVLSRELIHSQVNFETIINFYEFGVFSSVGQFLLESGFPVETIKILEDKHHRIMLLEPIVFRESIEEHLKVLSDSLDEYEVLLIKDIITSLV